MTADPYARLDAAYLLGALDADERLACEAYLVICRRCRAGLRIASRPVAWPWHVRICVRGGTRRVR